MDFEFAELIVGSPMRDEYFDGTKQDVTNRRLGDCIKLMDFVTDPHSLMQIRGGVPEIFIHIIFYGCPPVCNYQHIADAWRSFIQ